MNLTGGQILIRGCLIRPEECTAPDIEMTVGASGRCSTVSYEYSIVCCVAAFVKCLL